LVTVGSEVSPSTMRLVGRQVLKRQSALEDECSRRHGAEVVRANDRAVRHHLLGNLGLEFE
jgi:hypothetical protein